VTHDPPRRGPYPVLDEVIDLCRGRIGIMAELKSPYRYRRFDVVRRTVAALPRDAVVVSFESRALRAVEGLRTLQHVGIGVSIRRAASYAWGVGFADRNARRRAISKAQTLGLATAVYTVNERERMVELASLGVTGLITDRPEVALSVTCES
jgi:glycerophosphoryl diester phosphodiesterase